MSKPSEDYNLYVLRPDLARQWHPTKNGSLGPRDVTPGSRRQVWWLCEKGHWWQARICDRSRGMKCTFCRGLNKQGEQRMVDEKPELLKEWHPTRNFDLRAREASSQHKEKVWWICGQGHEWEATIRSRLTGKNCPFCGPPNPGARDLSVKNPGASSMRRTAESGGASAAPASFTAWREEPAASYEGVELRKSRRYQRSAVVMIEKPRSGILGYARLHNFSAGGMMLLSDFVIKPGEIISVRFDQPLYPSGSDVVTSKVVWCQDMEARREIKTCFGIGIRLV